MELCVETLGEVVSLLARNDVGPVEADRGELAKALLPTVLRIAATMMKDRNREEGIPSDDPLLVSLIFLYGQLRVAWNCIKKKNNKGGATSN